MSLRKKNGILVYYCDLGFNIKEREANNFAECFLMPKEKFVEVCNQNTRIVNGSAAYDIEKIADYFGLEVKYIVSRGINLGIFKG
jgi:Zn-dependent peptidase ImmA (M78 family)